MFSAEGVPKADPRDFKDSANPNIGANPGNMSVSNEAWNGMGAEAGAAQVRKAIEYLLRGTSPVDLEDRLTVLINDTTSFRVKGFKESLLTKVLCIVYPDRYLTILKYTEKPESGRLHAPSGDSNCPTLKQSTGLSDASSCGATTCYLHSSAKASGISSTHPNSFGGLKTRPRRKGPDQWPTLTSIEDLFMMASSFS